MTEFGELDGATGRDHAQRLRAAARPLPQPPDPPVQHVAATEPLSEAQMASIGWAGREGLSDQRALFMYLRLTADNRIVFGGESAPYFYDSSPSSGNYQPSLDKLHRSLRSPFRSWRVFDSPTEIVCTGVTRTSWWVGQLGSAATSSSSPSTREW